MRLRFYGGSMINNCRIKEIQIRHGAMVDLNLAYQAENMSLKDADAVLDAFEEFKFRITAPDTESPAAQKKPVPDPIDDAGTGCAECNPDQFHGGCETCSPPPAPIAVVLKEKFNPPEQPAKQHGGSQGHKGNKYGIPPSLFKTDKHEYQRLWALCKAHGLTYEQALTWKRLPSRTKGDQSNKVKPSAQAIAPSNDVKEPAAESKVKSKKQSGHPMKCPYCEKEINSHGAHVHMKSHGPEKYAEWLKDPDRLGTGVHRITTPHLPFHQKHDEPAVTEPHKNDPNHSSGQQAIRDLTKAQNGTLQIGRRVKHNGSKASPHYGQIGEIVGINKEELHVKFPTGDARLPSYLVLAMPEAKV